jgi:hypothetical protein
MKFFFLEPEVAGNIECSDMHRGFGFPVVRKLHYQFDGYLGGSIVRATPCYIVTEEAQRELLAMRATGVRFDKAETSTSDLFEELYPGRDLPPFVWAKIEGKPGRDDFGIAKDRRLVVSERALEVFKRLGLSVVAVVSEFP